MKTQSKWVVAGGAAAFVLTPVMAFAGPSVLEREINGSGVVVQATAASTIPSVGPSVDVPASSARAATQSAASPVSASGTKTVSAATPVSPQSASPPAEPDRGSVKASASAVSPVSPVSPKSPRTSASPNTP